MKILLVCLVFLMSGCTALGSNSYGCSGMPVGTGCTPSRELYEQTKGGSAPIQNIEKEQGKKQTSVKPEIDKVIDTFVTPQLPDKPIPIRTPSTVMRIWISTWEDSESGSLMAPGYVYTEIEPRRWVIGKPESSARTSSQVYKPLESTSDTTTKVNN